ncbi:MAG: hypothetical protein K2V38_11530 [Gemmataceae bacterium]|nr:hypothetical protein [Gemmataceae bacterium]
MTLDELKARYAAGPQVGCHRRRDFDRGVRGGLRVDHDGLVVIASLAYRYDAATRGLAGDQLVTVRGVTLHVYPDRRRESVEVRNMEGVEAAIDAAAEKARKTCAHDYAELARNVGNCPNVYRCGKCGAERTVDSSG